jgi:hypothetical protein
MGAAVFLTWDPQTAEALEVLGAPLFSAMLRVLLRARCPSPSLANQWAFYLLSGTVEWTSALPKAATRTPNPPGALPSLLALPGDLVSLDASGRFYTVSSVDNGIASLKQSGDHRVFVVPTVYLFVRRRAQANTPHRPKGPRLETGLPCNCGRADGGSGRHTDACASRVSTKTCQSRRLGTAEANASFLARTADRLRPVEPSTSDSVPTPAASATPTPTAPVFDTSSWPDPSTVASSHINLVERIAPGAVVGVAQALEWTLAVVASRPQSPDGWHLLWCFAKCVLSRPRRGDNVAATLNRRARQWKQGSIIALWEEAQAARARPGKQKAPVLVDEELLPGFLQGTFGSESTSEFSLADKERVLRRARMGHLAKAMAAMGAATPVPATEENAEALEALHPRAPPVDVDTLFKAMDAAAAAAAVPAQDSAEDETTSHSQSQSATPDPKSSKAATLFSKNAVMKALRSFTLGSGAGPSGISPAHLLGLCRVPTTCLPNRLVDVTNLLIGGNIPRLWRRFYFGASLSALKKKEGGIRPIACGETLRRLAGKTLCTSCKGRARELFLAVGQFGVGVGGGIEAVIHGARRLVARWTRDGCINKAFIKLDIRNAFNSMSREFLFRAVHRYFPEVEGYARAAYADHTALFFGNFVLSSEAGVQQGDPLGPLLFSAALMLLWETKPPDIHLDFVGFYLDDGNVGGDVAQVEAFAAWFEEAIASAGLLLSRHKCEIILPVPIAPLPRALHDFVRLPPEAWFLLGAPCGSEDFVHAYIETVLRRGHDKCRFIACLDEDPHVGFALLRYCASFCLSVFYARTSGLAPAYAVFDDAVRDCFSNLVTPIGGAVDDVQLSVPLRLGGFGLRRSADFAALGFLCSSAASTSLFPFMGSIPEDDVPLVSARSCPQLALFPTVQSLALDYSAAGGHFGDKKQKELSTLIDECMADRMVAVFEDAGDRRSLARLASCSAKGASAYLAVTFVAHAHFDPWMNGTRFVTQCRRRLGHVLAEAPAPCTICGKMTADVLGDHSAECMGGGQKTLVHHPVVQVLHERSSQALLHSVREATPFAGSAKRVDWFLRQLKEAHDFAVTSPMQSSAAMDCARVVPGGHATAYEATKTSHYAEECAVNGVKLFPVIVDSFGAFGSAAYPVLRKIALGLARRFGLPFSIQYQLLMLEVNVVLLSGLADVLACNM